MTHRKELTFSREEMREIGYAVIDSLLDYYDARDDRRVSPLLDHDMLDAILRETLPEDPSPWREVMAQFQAQVVEQTNHVDHPRFFGYIPLANNFIGVMADTLAAGHNIFNAIWLQGPGAAQIERLTVDWLRQIMGMPASAGGTFVSGGSVANLSGLAVARTIWLDDNMDGAVIYCSDQLHFAISRGLRLLGFRDEQLRVLQSDDSFRLPLDSLRAAIAEDRAAGKRPFCVAAIAGATSTGAVDLLDELADLCEDEDLWLHVDGAYGAPAMLCERGQIAMRGLGRAHSIALDAHKWLFQPIECGAVLVRERAWLKLAFAASGDFLKDMERPGEERNFGYQGIQLTRQFKALKLWMSFKVFGAGTMREAIDQGFVNGELAEETLRAAGCWDIVTPAQMAIVTFRYRPANGDAALADEITNGLVGRLLDDGGAFASGSLLRGRPVMRICANNPRTTRDDLQRTVALMGRLAREMEAALRIEPASD